MAGNNSWNDCHCQCSLCCGCFILIETVACALLCPVGSKCVRVVCRLVLVRCAPFVLVVVVGFLMNWVGPMRVLSLLVIPAQFATCGPTFSNG